MTEWGQEYRNAVLHVVVPARQVVLNQETRLRPLSCAGVQRSEQAHRGSQDENQVDAEPQSDTGHAVAGWWEGYRRMR